MNQVMRLFRCILLLVVLAVLLANTSAQAQPGGFTFTQINVPGSASIELDGINAQGEIVGFFVDQSGKQHGVVDQNGMFTQLDFPGATATKTRGHQQYRGRGGRFYRFFRGPAWTGS